MHRRLLSLTRNARLPLAITILSGFLGGLFTIAQARLFSHTVNAVFLGRLGLPQVSVCLHLLLVVIAMRATSVWLTELSASMVARRLKTNLREKLFAHILQLGPAYTHGERTGELTTAAMNGVEALDGYFSQYLPQLVISALVPLSVLVFVFPLDPLSGLVLFLTAPLIPFFMILIGKTAESLTKRQWETLSRLSAHFLDSLQGLTTLKLFGQSKAQAKSIAAVSDKFRDATLSVLRVTFLSALALELLATLSTAVIAVEVGLRLLYYRLSFEQALFLLVIAPEFYLPLRMLGLRFHAGMAGTNAARRIFDILDIKRESISREEAGKTSFQFSHLAFSNVSFTYPGETAPVLQDISLSIPAGKQIALVGPSGAGKSTLVNLLLGFIQPTSGQITTFLTPSAPVSGPPCIDQIAWVPQKPYLFHDTLAANIRLGKPSATDEEVAAAAQAASLDEFIRSLPEGYQTVIGEGGARLSGGQAQRLSLARAFLKDAPFLILDEPSSSLDPQTEAGLNVSAHHLRQGRTVLTIAHRLNTVQQADQIIVLDQGRVVETGTHAKLLARGGLYSQLIKAHMTDGVKNLQGLKTMGALLNRGQQEKYAQNLVSASLGGSSTASVLDLRSSAHAPRSAFQRLLGFLKGSWGQVVLSVLFGALTMAASISLLGTSAWLISTAALHPSIAELQVAIVGVRFFGISRGVFRYLERLTSHDVTFRLLSRLRTWFYERLEPLAPARLMDYHAGDLLSRIITDVEMLENFYVRSVAPPLTAILVCAVTCFFLGSFHPSLGLTLFGLLLTSGLLLPMLTRTLSRRPGQELVLRQAALHIQLVDGIQGLADLLAFGRGAERMEKFHTAGEEYAQSQQKMAHINALQSGMSNLITNLGAWAVLALAIPLALSNQLDGVMLAALALIALASFEAVQPLPLAAQMLSSSLESARRLFEIVDGEPVTDEQPAKPGELPINIPKHALCVAHLSFTYPGSNTPAIQDISFDLPEGGSLAIVGPSGAGKSTLVNLLMRFWNYQQGDILIGGESIRDHAQEFVRGQAAVLTQNAYFFNTSIRQNLLMARPGASPEEIEQAVHLAHLDGFIACLPRGYETHIGEQGWRLSGGERQRLGLARALLKGSKLLVLDEPTANLDPLTECQVLESIFDVMSSRSALLITHRLIGMERFDQVLVMDAGHIVERGKHNDLLAAGGFYHRLYNTQNQIFAPTSVEDLQ